MKLTFKTEKSTGRYRSFFPDTHYIKLDKKECGQITDTAPHSIMLSIQKECTKEDPAPFKNVYLKKKFDSVQAAKDFLIEKIDAINLQYSLYLHD